MFYLTAPTLDCESSLGAQVWKMAKLTKIGDTSHLPNENYYQLLRPLHYMVKTAGMWPQTLQRSSPGFTVWSIFYLACWYGFIGYCIYVNSSVSLWNQYLGQVDSNILQYGLQIHIVNGLAMGKYLKCIKKNFIQI